MTLIHIAVFIGFALMIRLLRNQNAAAWLMFLSSLIFIYWLQPVSSIRSLEFWLPSILVVLTMIVWVVTSAREALSKKENRLVGLLALVAIMGLSVLRYFNLGFLAELVNPPAMWQTLVFLLATGMLLWRLGDSPQRIKHQRRL